MKVYKMRCYDHDMGEVIRWFASRKEANAAVDEHRPFGGCGPAMHFEHKVQVVDIPETENELLAWLNKNIPGAGR